MKNNEDTLGRTMLLTTFVIGVLSVITIMTELKLFAYMTLAVVFILWFMTVLALVNDK